MSQDTVIGCISKAKADGDTSGHICELCSTNFPDCTKSAILKDYDHEYLVGYYAKREICFYCKGDSNAFADPKFKGKIKEPICNYHADTVYKKER